MKKFALTPFNLLHLLVTAAAILVAVFALLRPTTARTPREWPTEPAPLPGYEPAHLSHDSAPDKPLAPPAPTTCALTVSVTVARDIKSSYGVRVYLERAKDMKFYRATSTDERNKAQFHDIPEGDYVLSCDAEGAGETSMPVKLRRGANQLSMAVGPANCVCVTWIDEDMQGAKAGMKLGDLITSYNGTPIHALDTLAAFVQQSSPADDATVEVLRDGEKLTFRLKGGRIGINGSDFFHQ